MGGNKELRWGVYKEAEVLGGFCALQYSKYYGPQQPVCGHLKRLASVFFDKRS